MHNVAQGNKCSVVTIILQSQAIISICNHFFADPVFNPIVQTLGQIVLRPWCRGLIGLQRCAGVTGRKFGLRNPFVDVSQMSTFVSCASSLSALQSPEISALEKTIPVLMVKPPLFCPTSPHESHSPTTKTARTA